MIYFKTFDKLQLHEKTKILIELNLLYDLTTEIGNKALKSEFKYIREDIERIMKEKGLI